MAPSKRSDFSSTGKGVPVLFESSQRECYSESSNRSDRLSVIFPTVASSQKRYGGW